MQDIIGLSTAVRPRHGICYAPPACITVPAHLRITCINAGNFLLPIPPFAHLSSHYVEWLARYSIRVSHSLIGSKMKPHSRFLYESDRDINGRLAPRIPAQPNSLNLLPAQMFVVQPLRATHRVSGYASGGT